MTSQQENRTKQLEDELRKLGKNANIAWRESSSPESRGFVFGQINGVTVTVTPGGLVNKPAVRSYHPPRYPTPVVAAASADELWSRQKARDDVNLEVARARRT